MVYVPLVITVWVVIPAVITVMTTVTADIIDGVCVPFGVYSSVAAEKIMAFFIFFIIYLLPLTMMIFFYTRIIHALRTKVSMMLSSAQCISMHHWTDCNSLSVCQ